MPKDRHETLKDLLGVIDGTGTLAKAVVVIPIILIAIAIGIIVVWRVF